jgi:mannosyltransferase OCH1-like enzyme
MNIIQTYKTADIPNDYKLFVESVKEHNPDWNYMFFSDEDIVTFFKTDAPHHYDTFCDLKYKIQQLDFFRYCAVYHYGGIYIDLDVMIHKSFNDIDLTKCMFPQEILINRDRLLQRENYHAIVGNYTFYAPKNDPFIKLIINNIVNPRYSPDELESAMVDAEIRGANRIYTYVYYTTGPVLVTQSYLDYGMNVTVVEPDEWENNSFGNYGKHHAVGSWKSTNILLQPTMK